MVDRRWHMTILTVVTPDTNWVNDRARSPDSSSTVDHSVSSGAAEHVEGSLCGLVNVDLCASEKLKLGCADACSGQAGLHDGDLEAGAKEACAVLQGAQGHIVADFEASPVVLGAAVPFAAYEVVDEFGCALPVHGFVRLAADFV